jgi:NTP pyrophosphatase (non-canonical NTP hydrolase)
MTAATDSSALVRRINAIADPLRAALHGASEPQHGVDAGEIGTALRRLDVLVDDIEKGLQSGPLTFATLREIGTALRRLDVLVDDIEKGLQSGPLTFATLREIGVARSMRWHPGGLNEWSLSDWFTATMGELGEAANDAKKLNRYRDGMVGNDKTESELRASLADEIADVAIYLDPLAASEGIDLASAIIRKFNATSEKVGFPERLPE